MGFRKKKGVVLVVVIMVMAVLTILGTSILQVSVSEAKQASNEEKRIQAQYLARAGAEAALGAWSNAVSAGATLPSGTSDAVYLDSTNKFKNSPPTTYIGKFVSTITGTNPVTISSVGTVDTVSQTITATININTHITHVTNTGTEMASLGWYANNGQVSNSNPLAYNSLNAIIDPPSGNGILKFVHTDSTFQALSIDFKVDIWNFKNDLTLKSDKIIFEKLIDFGHGGSITLLTNPGELRAGHGTNRYGKVQYNGKWYWFLNNTRLTNPLSQLTDMISAGGDIPASIGTVITKDYAIKWN